MNPPPRWTRLLLIIGAFLIAACDDDPMGPAGPTGVETAVVLNSVEISISVFPVDSPASSVTTGVGPDGSTPVTLAAHGELVAVPLGLFPALAIIDLSTRQTSTVALPDNSGATGVAFANDSIVYVGNPNLNTVSVVNVRSGELGAEIPVGVFPASIAASSDHIFVLNSELENFVPARPGRVSVVDPASESVVSTIQLSGLNPADAAFGPDGRLYILNSGNFGGGNGSLSVVDPSTLTEAEHHEGFGDFPSDIAFGSDGLAYIGSFSFGVVIWDPTTDSFVRGPDDPLNVEGHISSSGVGFDSEGRLYWLAPGPDPADPATSCTQPSVALRLTPDLSFDREISVGICPVGIAFTRVAGT